MLRGLCSDLGFELVEWNPMMRGTWRNGQASNFIDAEPSLGDAFLRFLAQTDRYCSLQASSSSSIRRPIVALVRDFPFTLLEGDMSRQAAFIERFRDMINGGAVRRAVLCFNDSREDHRLVTRLMSFIDTSSVMTVLFDAVPRTFAQKALEAAAREEGLIHGSVDLAAIAAECGGDLRHAVNALQLAAIGSRCRPPGGACSQLLSKGSGHGRGAGRGRGRAAVKEAGEVEESDPSNAVSALRSASLGLFHALGRLLYCKRLPPDLPLLSEQTMVEGQAQKRRRKAAGAGPEPRQLPPELLMPKATRPALYFVPEEVLAASSAEPAMMIDWLFTNAPRFYGDVGDLAEFVQILATADVWSSGDGFRATEVLGTSMDELAAIVQTRALLDWNLHPVPPTFGDPAGAAHGSSEGNSASFNMVRPLMWDAARHRQRRLEELSVHLSNAGLRAVGSASAGTTVLLRTLPFVHLLLVASRGTHKMLRHLPHGLMMLVMELSSPIDGDLLKSGDARKGPAQNAVLTPSLCEGWGAALEDDPIEDD